jgi:hypothetical protein
MEEVVQSSAVTPTGSIASPEIRKRLANNALTGASPMDELSQQVGSLPWSGIIPVLLCLGAGAALWACGARILRPALALLGAAAGGLAGWTLGDALLPGLGIGVPGWAVGAAAALVMGFIAWASFRIALAFALAGIFALAAPLGVLAAAEAGLIRADDSPWAYQSTPPAVVTREEGSLYFFDDAKDAASAASLKRPVDDPTRGLPGDLLPFVQQALSLSASDTGDSAIKGASELATGIELSESMQQHVDQAQGVAQELLDAAQERWERTPEGLRPTLLGAAIVGAILGLVIGGVLAKTAAIVLTAAAGGGLVLAAGSVLIGQWGLNGAWMPPSSGAWAGLWLITTGAGAVIQFMLRPRPADKSG